MIINKRAAKILEHYNLEIGAGYWYDNQYNIIKFTEFNTNLNYAGKKVSHTVKLLMINNHNMVLVVTITELIRFINNFNIKILSPLEITRLERLNRI